MTALFELGASGAADAVRNGEQTAEALAEALLARCAAAAPLNTFISLEAEGLRAAARRRPAASARRAARAAAWSAARAQGQHRYLRFSDHRRNASSRGASAETQRSDRAALARCRRHRARQNQSARACLWSDEQQHGVRSGAQSVRSHAHPGRFEWW